MENLLLFGYVFILFVCFWFGNFITSFYFRIPRNIPLNGKMYPPMCSTCGVRLKYPDYGPLYHYIFRGKKCKICGAPIPKEYFYIELFTGLICLSVFVLHGITEKSCFMVLTVLTYILCFLINVRHGFIPEKAIWLTLVSTITYVTFSLKNENDILYTIITNVSVGFIFGFILKKLIEGNFGIKGYLHSGRPAKNDEKGSIPQGYLPMLAIISLVHTKGISIGLFTISFLALLTKKVSIRNLFSAMFALSVLIIISDISFPYLEL